MHRALRLLAPLFLLSVLAGFAAGQNPPFGVDFQSPAEEGWQRLIRNPAVTSSFRMRVERTELKAGEETWLEIEFRMQETPEEYYLEGPHSENVPLRVLSSDGDLVEVIGIPEGPKGKTVYDELLEKNVQKIVGAFTVRQKLRVRGDAPGGEHSLRFELQGQSCKEGSCDTVKRVGTDFRFQRLVADAQAAAAEVERRAEQAKAAVDGALATASGGGAVAAGQPEGLLAFLVFCFGGGLLMLLLPCIWPMIPITVSYFTKQSENRRGGAASLAFLYGVGIILTYALIGLVTTVWLGPKAAQDFATHPILNLAIGILFVVFALSFFGMFELTLPPALTERLNRATGGGGMGNQGRLIGTLLLGAMFTVTSFACSAPVMASIWAIGFAQGGSWWLVPLGMATAAVALSLPFVILALFPSLLKAMPRSGGWMNTVKAFLGFVELAAALKFFSNADLKWDLQILTWPVFMAVWVAIAGATTLYLFGLIRLPHDDPSHGVSPARMSFGVLSGSAMLMLMVGLFAGEPMPDVVTSFVPPKYYGRPHVAAEELEWIEDWDQVLEVARLENKPIFLDFTGVNCTNCRLVEEGVFPHVKKQLERFVRGRLFTDAGARQDEYDERKVAFGSYGLPFYVMLSPDGKTVLGTSEYERRVPVFRAFLEGGLRKAGELGATKPREPVAEPTHGGDPAGATAGAPAAAGGELVWYEDLDEARRVAKSSGRRLFLDFTGKYCIPCKAMEKKVFPEPEVERLFRSYVLVKLVTDLQDDPVSEAKAAYLRSINDGSHQVPVYAIETADGELIEKLSGKQDLQVFVEFLDRAKSSDE